TWSCCGAARDRRVSAPLGRTPAPTDRLAGHAEARSRARTTLGVLLGGLVALSCSFLAWRVLGSPQHGIDDANITFVYAANLAQGRGYTYGVGGERVEGSTSPLWTLVCALAFATTDSPESVLLAASFALTALAGGLAMAIARRAAGDSAWWPAIGAIW